jgi:predicted O-methyltransferase YrrM
MLDRIKAAARQKLQRAVAEVVRQELARSQEHQDALLAESRAKLDELGDQAKSTTDRLNAVDGGLGAIDHRLGEMEHRARRDIAYAHEVVAAQESAAFALEHMPKAPVFWHPHDTLRFALAEIKGSGLALEFGVASGTTLGIIADSVAGELTVVGFDIFTGLPETWRTGFPEGEFAQDKPPEVPGARVIIGLFEDTLPGFLMENDEPIAFMHLDADLYSSTKTVLEHTADRLAPGAVVVFDEFFNYPGWQQHEFRAWEEFVAATGRAFDYLAYTGNNEQVVVRLQ